MAGCGPLPFRGGCCRRPCFSSAWTTQIHERWPPCSAHASARLPPSTFATCLRLTAATVHYPRCAWAQPIQRSRPRRTTCSAQLLGACKTTQPTRSEWVGPSHERGQLLGWRRRLRRHIVTLGRRSGRMLATDSEDTCTCITINVALVALRILRECMQLNAHGTISGSKICVGRRPRTFGGRVQRHESRAREQS